MIRGAAIVEPSKSCRWNLEKGHAVCTTEPKEMKMTIGSLQFLRSIVSLVNVYFQKIFS